jgi:hypothetical protein
MPPRELVSLFLLDHIWPVPRVVMEIENWHDSGEREIYSGDVLQQDGNETSMVAKLV